MTIDRQEVPDCDQVASIRRHVDLVDPSVRAGTRIGDRQIEARVETARCSVDCGKTRARRAVDLPEVAAEIRGASVHYDVANSALGGSEGGVPLPVRNVELGQTVGGLPVDVGERSADDHRLTVRRRCERIDIPINRRSEVGVDGAGLGIERKDVHAGEECTCASSLHFGKDAADDDLVSDRCDRQNPAVADVRSHPGRIIRNDDTVWGAGGTAPSHIHGEEDQHRQEHDDDSANSLRTRVEPNYPLSTSPPPPHPHVNSNYSTTHSVAYLGAHPALLGQNLSRTRAFGDGNL